MSSVGLNRAVLIGDVDRVEFRVTATGKSRLWLKVHTHELTVDDDGKERERHAWNTVVVWGKRADAMRDWLTKGRKIAVEGRIVTSKWEKDGQKRYETEVHAASIVFLDRRPAAA